MQDQLKQLGAGERVVDLPITGALLEKRVRLSISSGLVDLNKYIKQATVRFDVMVQLIALHKAAGKPDYQHLDMDRVRQRAFDLNPFSEAAIPFGLQDVLDRSDDDRLDATTDKAATHA